MNLIEITFKTEDADHSVGELLPYRLESIGFEGFCEADAGLIAYIEPSKFNRNTLLELLRENGLSPDCFEEKLLADKNWNEEWEKNFQPVAVEDKCYIRAPFHKPETGFLHEIIIEPKMSFGTGHHATTMLMVKEMLQTDLHGKQVFDAGCGTGILAILAEKLGAKRVMAIDIDEWSYNNALENVQRNHCSKIDIHIGDAGTVTGEKFDCILANINLNILRSGLQTYYNLLISGGLLIMSGILETDIKALCNEAMQFPLEFLHQRTLNNWALTSFRKK